LFWLIEVTCCNIWGEGFSLHVKQTEEAVKVFNNLSEHAGFVGWGEFTNPNNQWFI